MDQKNASLLNSYALFMDNLSSHRTKNVFYLSLPALHLLIFRLLFI